MILFCRAGSIRCFPPVGGDNFIGAPGDRALPTGEPNLFGRAGPLGQPRMIKDDCTPDGGKHRMLLALQFGVNSTTSVLPLRFVVNENAFHQRLPS